MRGRPGLDCCNGGQEPRFRPRGAGARERSGHDCSDDCRVTHARQQERTPAQTTNPVSHARL
ncbi:hypothetical protein BIWAKO_02915 [Bosea sp. BIWAKO-01]|nr:hypothetical protein BIWAKO_02915 [Bosea sp. BIWAKO-01]